MTEVSTTQLPGTPTVGRGECKDQRIVNKATGRRRRGRAGEDRGWRGEGRRGREEEKRGGEGRVGPGCWCEFEAKEGRGERKISIYGKKTEGSTEQRREPFTLRELVSEVWRRWMRRRTRGEGVHLIWAADPFFPLSVGFAPHPLYLCSATAGEGGGHARGEEEKDAVSRLPLSGM